MDGGGEGRRRRRQRGSKMTGRGYRGEHGEVFRGGGWQAAEGVHGGGRGAPFIARSVRRWRWAWRLWRKYQGQ
jgi:hypothetical protein